nr:hypothetical protein [Chloroflexaceae bacterium]
MTRDTAQVLQLRLRSLTADQAVARRLRLERQLATVELRPPGMPGGAVLLVRSLRAAAPAATGPLPPAPWRTALANRMAQLYHEAACPAAGPVPAAAASVLFADAAEMLVCFSRDVLGGRLGQQWYWQHLLPVATVTPGAALARAWQAHVQALPAALAQLRPTETSALLHLLAPAEVNRIIQSLHKTYALPPLAADAPANTPQAEAAHNLAPPWQAWLPASTASGLGKLAHYLLGTALVLAHAPALARSATFTRQAEAWLEADPTQLAAGSWQLAGKRSDAEMQRRGDVGAVGAVGA